jgi:hypothetical protein
MTLLVMDVSPFAEYADAKGSSGRGGVPKVIKKTQSSQKSTKTSVAKGNSSKKITKKSSSRGKTVKAGKNSSKIRSKKKSDLVGKARKDRKRETKQNGNAKNKKPKNEKSAFLKQKTVLGHYPKYITLSNKVGARRFEIPGKIWNKMKPAEQWAANKKFLDRLVQRGDKVMLATPAGKAKPGSFYAKELKYLSSKGYRISSNGKEMLPPKK